MVPSKHCFNLLDQLKIYNCGLPTARVMQEHFGSLTTMPKEVMQTRRGRGVLIEPLEPDDSDEGCVPQSFLSYIEIPKFYKESIS